MSEYCRRGQHFNGRDNFVNDCVNMCGRKWRERLQWNFTEDLRCFILCEWLSKYGGILGRSQTVRWCVHFHNVSWLHGLRLWSRSSEIRNQYGLHKSHSKVWLEIRGYILGVVSIAFILLYIIDCLDWDSRDLTECNKKYQAIVSKRTRFSQRLWMFFTRNYIETGNLLI